MISGIKKGLDYFPIDIDFFNDEKVELVSARHGILAELIAIKLLSRIYRNGYYIEWNEDTILLYSKKFGDEISFEYMNDVVKDLIKRGFFNKRLFDEYSILTSMGIQKRYLKATKRRKETEIVKKICLFSIDDARKINQNVNIISENTDIMQQSKVKESKEKNIKPFVEGSNELRLSKYLFSKIHNNNPKAKEPNLQTWAKHIDLMIRVDKRLTKDIEDVIEWCQKDSFWQSNILSTAKLRKQFDQLYTKMGGNNGKPKPDNFSEKKYTSTPIEDIPWMEAGKNQKDL